MTCIDKLDGFECVPSWVYTTQESTEPTAPPSVTTETPSGGQGDPQPNENNSIKCENGETTRKI